jgi:hypothetical protein
MNEFVRFDPFIHANPDVELIQSLRNRNTLLTICLVTAVCIAAYFAYRYYQINDYQASDRIDNDF